LLDSLEPVLTADHDVSGEVRALLEVPEDGRAKLYLTARVLRLRRARATLFGEGVYQPLEAEGAGAERVCSFSRGGEDDACCVVVAPYRFAALTAGASRAPLGAAVWGDTAVVMPEAPTGPSPGPGWLEIFTGRRFTAGRAADGRARLALAALLDSFPVALLLREPVGPG